LKEAHTLCKLLEGAATKAKASNVTKVTPVLVMKIPPIYVIINSAACRMLIG
jgi:hypothetical protein